MGFIERWWRRQRQLRIDTWDSFWFVLREYAETLLIAVLLAVLLRAFVVAAYRMPTDSMMPAVWPGDFLLGYKLPYGLDIPFSDTAKLGIAKPRRGDVAIFRCPDQPDTSCIKRIIGFPGDRIELRKQRLIINGERAEYEQVGPHLQLANSIVVRERWRRMSHNLLLVQDSKNNNVQKWQDFGPLIVPPGHLFVLSDKRDEVNDSRLWGTIALNALQARAWFVWFSVSWNRDDQQVIRPDFHWQRIGLGIN